LTKTERFKILLEKGYLPEELPPSFNTEHLARYRESVAKKWAKIPKEYPKTNNEIYSIPRIKHSRRNLSVANPISQFYLSKLIADNWIEIRIHLKRSEYSIEVPEIEKDGKRAISKPDFPLTSLRENKISANFDHALVSDISRFYGTLYTHAVPWALHTKLWCKNNLYNSSYKKSLGARLDKAVQRGQDNQTIGIPVGPDTSRVISEIVGVAIDGHVQNVLDLDKNRALRHIDDWYIGFDNAGEAEDAVAELSIACRNFELELNAEKTKTFNASAFVDNIWPSELSGHTFKPTEKGQQKSLEHFFIKAFHFAKDYPKQNVLSYAVEITQSIQVQKQNWEYYETFLLKIARSNPTTIPKIVEIFVSYKNDGYKIGNTRIKKFIKDLIRKNAPVAHHAEVAWALFLAKSLKLSLSSAEAQAVCELESSICALLALDLQSNELFEGPLDTTIWRQSLNPQGLLSKLWLLAYEADLKGWLNGDPATFVNDNPYFKVLKSKKISFYDTTKNVTHIKKKKRWGSSKIPTASTLSSEEHFILGTFSPSISLD